MSSTLPLFWHLSSASKKDRIDASVKLIGALERFQTQFVPNDSSETSDDEDEGGGPNTDGLDALNAQDVSYSIRRLIRGLASPRESSRLGFAVALTELLSRINTVTCSQIISIILDSSKTQGSMTGQEERDVLFARLFGLTSVIQSGLLVRQTPLLTSASTSVLASSFAGYTELLSQLLALGEKKSWLRETVWWTIGLALDALDSSNVDWKGEATELTLQSIFVHNKIWTPEKTALALKLQASYPELDWRKFLSPTFKNPELLSAGNLSVLAKILKESSLDDEDGSNGTKSALGNWKPQVHFIWDIILDQLLGDRSSNSSGASFKEFFRVVVDESLFSSTSSSERKYWGFQIFQKALPRVDASDMPMLFTKNFMRSWINHLSNDDRYLHKIARQVATDIQSFVQKNPTLGFTLILQLTGANGNRQFDKLTKTKTVESILASMNAEGIETYIDYLLKQVDEESGEKNDTQAVNAKRVWIIDQLGALIRNSSIPKNDDWIQSILDWFIVNGLFVIKKKSERSPYRALHAVPTPMFSDDLRQSCRTRLLTCLADLTGQVTLVRSEDDKTQKVSGVTSNGEFWVSRALGTIEILEKDIKHVSLLEDADEDDQAVRAEARRLVETLKKMPVDRQDAAKGAELLLSAIVVQQYNANEEDRDSAALEVCIDAITRMFVPNNKNKRKSRKSSNDAESASEPIDILIDTIIGFLEQSTAYLRSMGNHAFSLLSGVVEETTIDLILTQLERRNPAELAANEEDDEMEVLEDNVEVDDEDDEASVDDDEASFSEVGDEDDDESGDDEDFQELRRKIEEALKVNGIEAATGDSDEGSDEDLMDDDQMMAIDEQLVKVFQSRANEKRSSKDVDAQREATHFKNRVLDLVDIFIKKQPSSQHIVRLVLPLVELISGTGSDERQLADKATGLLRNRIGKSKDLPSCTDSEQVATILEELHGRAKRARSSEMLATISQCSLYLSKIMLHSGAEDSVLRVYRLSLVDFITRKASPLNTSFLQDFIRRHPTSGWSLRGDIIDASTKAANAYRQCQAFQLLQAVLNQLPALGDRQQEILAFMPIFRTALTDFMLKACDEKVILTVPQMKDLFKLGLVAIRQTQRIASSQGTLQTIWPPSTWDALHKKLTTSERFGASAALQTMYKQMVKMSQGTVSPPKKSKISQGGLDNDVPVAAATKRKADTSGDDEGAVATKKAKRKKVKKTKV